MTIVIYHDQCPDGFSASIAATPSLPADTRFVGGNYDKDLPYIERGEDVFILDLSYPADVLQEVVSRSARLVLLDHHQSALDRLGQGQVKLRPQDVIQLDMRRSGAMMAWDYFNPGTPAPMFLRRIQARDLYTWDAPHAEEYLEWLNTQPLDRALWAQLFHESEESQQSKIRDGAMMLAPVRALAQNLAARAVPVEVLGVQGLMVNAPTELVDRTCNLLAQQCGTFGLAWHMAAAGHIKVSLRSLKFGDEVSTDVAKLAEAFGGGGHRSSAAFIMDAADFFQHVQRCAFHQN